MYTFFEILKSIYKFIKLLTFCKIFKKFSWKFLINLKNLKTFKIFWNYPIIFLIYLKIFLKFCKHFLKNFQVFLAIF